MIQLKQLTREEFREGVFKRDGYKCVFCGLPAKDAHHILERRLFSNGGYEIDNGVSVCHDCHLACESTEISAQECRDNAGIKNIVLPEHLYRDNEYDKWGNIILPNGMRTKGELFYDESVQRILKPVLHLFTDYVKYPRTYHLPWSNCSFDDKKLFNSDIKFHNKEVVVTEKLDGENTTLYNDYYHARSIDSGNHPSRNYAKSLWSKFAHDIPKGWRVCCENLYAQHSIHYDDLKDYLYGLSIWNDKNECLSWDETLEWFELFNLPYPTIYYRGIYDEELLYVLKHTLDEEKHEGYVVRVVKQFNYINFKNSVAKYVRPGHVQTTKHWMHGQRIIKNGISGSTK